MSTPRPRAARKVLVASMGVATMTYVISCGGGTTTNGDGGPDAQADSIDEHPVANLVGHPVDASDHATVDEFPVANLVANPDSGPHDATVNDTIDDFPVANLVAVDVGPKDVSPPKDAPTDVTPPTDATPPKDAKTKDTIDDFPVANLVVHPG